MNVITIAGLSVFLLVVLYDETAGTRLLSRTISGKDTPPEIIIIKENATALTMFGIVFFVAYMISEKIAIGMAAVVLVSLILSRREI